MIRFNRGQLYKLVGTFPHIRKDGTHTQLHRWVSACAQCGEPFFITTPAAASNPKFNRRCQKHKRPGQQVRSAHS